MENQHRQIKGYRELDQAEIDLINEIKQQGAALQQLLDKVGQADAQGDYSEAARWRALAKTHLQQGLMALTRAVAKPDFF